MEILRQALQLCDKAVCYTPIWRPPTSLQIKLWDLYFLCFKCTHIHVLHMYVGTVYMCMSVVYACVSVCLYVCTTKKLQKLCNTL